MGRWEGQEQQEPPARRAGPTDARNERGPAPHRCAGSTQEEPAGGAPEARSPRHQRRTATSPTYTDSEGTGSRHDRPQLDQTGKTIERRRSSPRLTRRPGTAPPKHAGKRNYPHACLDVFCPT